MTSAAVLSGLREARDIAETRLTAGLRQAVLEGYSYSAISRATGLTRQAISQRFKGHLRPLDTRKARR